MIDPTGFIVTTVRDFADVVAITPRVRGGELHDGDAPPAVVIRRLARTRSPLGGGTGRTGIQGLVLAALCYGATRQQASQLAGAVSDAVHQKGPRTDASGRLIYLSTEQSADGGELDPDTRWPFETVLINVIAAAQAVT